MSIRNESRPVHPTLEHQTAALAGRTLPVAETDLVVIVSDIRGAGGHAARHFVGAISEAGLTIAGRADRIGGAVEGDWSGPVMALTAAASPMPTRGDRWSSTPDRSLHNPGEVTTIGAARAGIPVILYPHTAKAKES